MKKAKALELLKTFREQYEALDKEESIVDKLKEADSLLMQWRGEGKYSTSDVIMLVQALPEKNTKNIGWIAVLEKMAEITLSNDEPVRPEQVAVDDDDDALPFAEGIMRLRRHPILTAFVAKLSPKELQRFHAMWDVVLEAAQSVDKTKELPE